MWITRDFQDWTMHRNQHLKLSVLLLNFKKVIPQSPKSHSFLEDQVEQVEKEVQKSLHQERLHPKRLRKDNSRELILRIKMLQDRDQDMDRKGLLQCRILMWMMMLETQKITRVSYRIRLVLNFLFQTNIRRNFQTISMI